MRLPAVRRASGIAAVVALILIAMIGVPAGPAAAAGEINVRKYVDGEQANSAPGPSVEAGARVQFRYVITVSSSEPLYDFVVTDTGGVTPDCDLDGDGSPDGYNGHPGPLRKGNQFICFATETAGEAGATKASIGRVKAFNIDISSSFEADDVSHYTTVAPATTSSATTSASTGSSGSSSTEPSSTAPSSTAGTTSSSEATTTGSTARQPSTATSEPFEAGTSGIDVPTSATQSRTNVTTLGGDSVTTDSASSASPGTDPNTTGNPNAGPTTGPATGSTSGTPTSESLETAPSTERENTETAADTASDTESGDGNALAADDYPPPRLAFADDIDFSFPWALLAAMIGAGLAVASHRQTQRKRDSVPSKARD